MNWTWYLFGFKGRINRAKYWLAGLVIVAFMMIFVALVYLTSMINFVAHAMGTAHGSGEVSFGFDLDDIFSVLDPAAWRAQCAALRGESEGANRPVDLPIRSGRTRTR